MVPMAHPERKGHKGLRVRQAHKDKDSPLWVACPMPLAFHSLIPEIPVMDTLYKTPDIFGFGMVPNGTM
jgi:hypothetical protein